MGSVRSVQDDCIMQTLAKLGSEGVGGSRKLLSKDESLKRPGEILGQGVVAEEIEGSGEIEDLGV